MDEHSIQEVVHKVKSYKGSAGAVKRVSELPRELFGDGRGWRGRRDVLMALALSADPDGLNGYPGYALIAERAAMSERNARRCLLWLQEHNLLEIFPYAGPKHTHRYIIRFPEPNSGADNPDSIVSESTRTISTGNPDNKTSQPGQLASEPGQYSVRQPSFDLPTDQKERPKATTAPLPLEAKATTPAKQKIPLNGRSAMRSLFADLAKHSSTSWIIPTPKLRKAVEEAFADGHSQQEIHSAIQYAEIDENDSASWRTSQLADKLQSCLDADSDKREERIRLDESVRIQQEKLHQQLAREEEERRAQEIADDLANREFLAAAGLSPEEIEARMQEAA